LRVLAGLEVPEEGTDVVVEFQDRGGKVNIAAVGFDSGRGLAEVSLDDLVVNYT
jgi:hypothetical protein